MADQAFAVTSGFYDSVNKDRLYSADQMNMPYKRLVSNGVFATPAGTPSDDLRVRSTGGMTIQVLEGNGLFGDKWFENPAALTITVPSNTSVMRRVDSVIAQVDRRTSGRIGNIIYRTGTPAASPVHPPLNTETGVFEYRLADVSVAPSTNTLSQSNITDRRGSAECPWVTSLIYQVDTSTLFEQYQAAYSDFFDESTQEFQTYTAQQRASWDAFIKSLTQDLTVTTSLLKLESLYTSTAAVSTIPVNIAGYTKATDILQVFINGILAVEGTHYTVSANGQNITLTTAITAGQKVHFVCWKSVITGDLQAVQTLIQQLDARLSAEISDSGWINADLENDAAAASGYPAPGFRKIGKTVHLRGAFTGLTTAGATVFTLPVGFRPAGVHTITAAAISGSSVTGTVALRVLTNGQVKILAKESAVAAGNAIPITADFLIG